MLIISAASVPGDLVAVICGRVECILLPIRRSRGQHSPVFYVAFGSLVLSTAGNFVTHEKTLF